MKIFKSISAVLIVLFTGIIPVNAEMDICNKGIILIDPGHGGIDGGAKSANGALEKELNLAIGLKLRDSLEKKGYKVYMTRDKDEALASSKREDLGLRCKMKKDVGCSMFISIHQNTFPKARCKGAQVWYASNNESKMLAENIQESIRTNLETDNKRQPKDAKQAYKILKDGNLGANLILECGFLSNNSDEKNLVSEEYQQKLVDCVILGVEKYNENRRIGAD